jgi:hypothetical protein
MELEISIPGWESIQKAWKVAPNVVREEMIAATWQAEMYLQREVSEATPVGAHGLLRRSITAEEPQVLADGVLGVVGSSLNYVEAVELGTKPHWAPLQPLIDWVEAKLGVPAADVEGVARRIQLGIAHHGTPGYGMFHGAFNRGQETVYRIYEAAQGRIMARIASGAV